MSIEQNLSDDKVKSLVDVGGVVFTVLMILYGLLIQLGLAKTAYTIGPGLFWILILALLPIGLIELLSKPKRQFDTFIRLLAYYLLGSAILFFITGLDSPFAAFWVVLMLGSFAHFGQPGVILSVAWFSVLAVSDFFIDYIYSGEINLSYFIIVAVVFSSGIVILSIARLQSQRARELMSSKMRESRQRDSLNIIINNLTNAVVSTGEDGRIELYNAAAANLFNTNVSMIDKSIDRAVKFYSSDGKPFHLITQLKKINKTTILDDLRLKYNDDDEIRVELTISPIRASYSESSGSDTHQGYIILARDITKSKSLEDEKDEFVSVVSHELRTPIATAEGAVSNLILMLDHPDVDISMKKDSAEQAHKEIVFLSKMINDLSTLSRAERGSHGEPEVIDVPDLVHTLYNEFSEEARKKKLRLDLNLGRNIDSVYASRLYLEELLQNFVSNAIKYTLEGSVTITVEQKNDTIIFSVKDTGIGISKSEQDKIFTKFYRIEDYRTRETSGTGLGLYITSKLADKLGTDIKLTSRLNHGSTFSISLPVYRGK